MFGLIPIQRRNHREACGPTGAAVPFSMWGSDMDRLVERLFGESFGPEGLPASPTVRLDFEETSDAFVVRAEVPGVEPADLSISLMEDVLTLSGEKKLASSPEAAAGRSCSERVYGAFQRSLRLPGPVDAKAVKATHKNGVVTVTLPKAEGARPTRIEIASA